MQGRLNMAMLRWLGPILGTLYVVSAFMVAFTGAGLGLVVLELAAK